LRTYGLFRRAVQAGSRRPLLIVTLVCAIWFSADPHAASAQGDPVRLVAFGDSLSAGYELPPDHAFPVRLEKALKARGHDVTIANAGVSGDTTSAGLARLDWSIPDGTDGVILELGANDALRGIPIDVTRQSLEAIAARLKERGIAVLVAGMLAPPNMGPDYGRAFNALYPDLAARHGFALYPFFLDGVAAEPALNLDDGMHPNEEGVDVIVKRITPHVETLIEGIRQTRKQASDS